MNRLPLLLSSVALATLAGCATESAITSAAAPMQLAPALPYAVGAAGMAPAPQASAGSTVGAAPAAAGALRAGLGRIESIMVVPPAVAGRAASKTNKHIAMRMEDGAMQYFDTKARVAVGDRIEITSNGTMRRQL
jgi:hypothetical protein